MVCIILRKLVETGRAQSKLTDINNASMIELFICASDSGAIDGEEKDGVLSFGEFSGPLSQVCKFHTMCTLL